MSDSERMHLMGRASTSGGGVPPPVIETGCCIRFWKPVCLRPYGDSTVSQCTATPLKVATYVLPLISTIAGFAGGALLFNSDREDFPWPIHNSEEVGGAILLSLGVIGNIASCVLTRARDQIRSHCFV